MFRKMACRVVLTSTNMISSTACHLDPMDSMLQLQILSRGLGKLQTMSVPFTQIQYTNSEEPSFLVHQRFRKSKRADLEFSSCMLSLFWEGAHISQHPNSNDQVFSDLENHFFLPAVAHGQLSSYCLRQVLFSCDRTVV